MSECCSSPLLNWTNHLWDSPAKNHDLFFYVIQISLCTTLYDKTSKSLSQSLDSSPRNKRKKIACDTWKMYILGVDIPENKYVWLALTRIYGIGPSIGRSICDKLSISRKLKMKDLSETKVLEITQILNGMTIETELKRKVEENIKTLVQINCYRGLRHLAKLPVHGQRTRSGAKTARKLNGRNLGDLRSFHWWVISKEFLDLKKGWN